MPWRAWPNSWRKVSTSPRRSRAGRSSVGLLRFITSETWGRTLVPSFSIHWPWYSVIQAAAALALARIEIDEEHGKVAAVAVIDLVGAHVGVIDGDLLVLTEGDAVEARGQSEDALDDVFHLKIGAEHLGVEVVAAHLQLEGVVGRVLGWKSKSSPSSSLVKGHDLGALPGRPWACRPR